MAVDAWGWRDNDYGWGAGRRRIEPKVKKLSGKMGEKADLFGIAYSSGKLTSSFRFVWEGEVDLSGIVRGTSSRVFEVDLSGIVKGILLAFEVTLFTIVHNL